MRQHRRADHVRCHRAAAAQLQTPQIRPFSLSLLRREPLSPEKGKANEHVSFSPDQKAWSAGSAACRIRTTVNAAIKAFHSRSLPVAARQWLLPQIATCQVRILERDRSSKMTRFGSLKE